MTKHRRKSAGRPRKPKTGNRYPCGKLRPAGPNEATLAHRKAICADPTMASCPLDAAFANGWLTFEEHMAGEKFANAYGASGLAGGRSVTAAASRELPQSALDLRGVPIQDMTSKEIAAAWDSAMRDGPGLEGEGRETLQKTALALYKAMHGVLAPGEGQVLFQICVQQQWPLWFAKRQAGIFDSVHEATYQLLISGLRKIAQSRRPTTERREYDRPVTAITAPRPAPAAASFGPDETINYVTPEGELIREVVKVRRRPKAGRVSA